MTTRTGPITTDVIRQAIDGIDAIANASIRTDYVGRGMRGEPCLGVVVSNASELLTLGASIAYVIALNADEGEEANDIDDAISRIDRACVDNMGLDLIVYWPGITA